MKKCKNDSMTQMNNLNEQTENKNDKNSNWSKEESIAFETYTVH